MDTRVPLRSRPYRTAVALFAGLLFAAASQAATIKIATVAPEGSAWMKEMRAGAAALKERTAGRVELKFYPAGVMGNDSAVIRKIKLGQLQGAAFSGAEASLITKDAPIYSQPFLFRDQAEVDAVRAKVDPLLRQSFEHHGMVVAGISGGGFAYIMSTRPMRTRDELRAAKVWVPPSDRIAQVAYETGGVSPIALPMTDVYPGLQTGLIDTVANTPAGSIFFQWHTKLKYMVDLPLTYVIGLMVIDQKALDKVDAADRAAVLDEVQKAFDKIDAGSRSDNEAARGTLAKQGIAIAPPSADEVTFWRDIGEQSQKKLEAEGMFTPSLLAALREAIAAARAGTPGGKQ